MGRGCWRGLRAVALPASAGTAFPLAGFHGGRPACPGLGEPSEAHTLRFDPHSFHHPKPASPIHAQTLSKRRTVSSFCVSFNSFLFFLVWQLLCLPRIRNNPLAGGWPFCSFACAVSDKRRYFRSCSPLPAGSQRQVAAVGLVGWCGAGGDARWELG